MGTLKDGYWKSGKERRTIPDGWATMVDDGKHRN